MDDPNNRQNAPFPTNVWDPYYDPADIERNKAVSMLAYLGILFFLPLVVCPNSRFGRYHANQGLVLFLFSAVGNLAFRHLLFFGRFFGWIYGVLMLILLIVGMVNAYNGRAVPLPVIGGIRIIR
jgi:uncharacterized membrane protein